MQTHISIPVDNEFITGDLFKPEGKASATMLICHGWTSSNKKYLPLAESLSKAGLLVLAINLRGMGDSIYKLEKYSRQDHLNDLTKAIDYVRFISKTPLILMGKSYGGYLSAIASSLREIDFLILSQPALYPDNNFNMSNAELIKNDPTIFRSSQEVSDTNKALKSTSQYTHPLLIIESEHDEEVHDVPQLYIRASEKNSNLKSIIIKDTDHPLTRHEWRENYFDTITSWLESNSLLMLHK